MLAWLIDWLIGWLIGMESAAICGKFLIGWIKELYSVLIQVLQKQFQTFNERTLQ